MSDRPLSDNDHRILVFIEAQVHPTTADIQRYLIGQDRSTRSTQRALKRLCADGYLAARPLFPERGGASSWYYSLRLKGARTLGTDRLGQQHYRPERRAFYRARHARMELAYLAAQYGWELYTTEEDGRHALLAYLLDVARAEYGEAVPETTVTPLLPDRISPDLILSVAGQEALIVILAHPHSVRGFWQRRREQYRAILSIARALAVVLTETQRTEATLVLGRPPVAGRFLVVLPTELPGVFDQLAHARNAR